MRKCQRRQKVIVNIFLERRRWLQDKLNKLHLNFYWMKNQFSIIDAHHKPLDDDDEHRQQFVITLPFTRPNNILIREEWWTLSLFPYFFRPFPITWLHKVNYRHYAILALKRDSHWERYTFVCSFISVELKIHKPNFFQELRWLKILVESLYKLTLVNWWQCASRVGGLYSYLPMHVCMNDWLKNHKIFFILFMLYVWLISVHW